MGSELFQGEEWNAKKLEGLLLLLLLLFKQGKGGYNSITVNPLLTFIVPVLILNLCSSLTAKLSL